MILVVIVILLVWSWIQCRKSGFSSAIYSGRCTGNLWMNGNSPQWRNGAYNSGRGGSMDDHVPVEYTYPYSMGTRAIVRPCYVDQVNNGEIKIPFGKVMGMPDGTMPADLKPMSPAEQAMKEKFEDPSIPPAKLWDEVDPEYEIKYLMQGPCGWSDTGAAAEAQALASMGVYGHSPYGAASFQKMVDDTYSIDGGVNQSQWQYQNEMTGGM